MITGAMVCSCCGHWRVGVVTVQPDPARRPTVLLRLTHHGYLVGEYPTAGQLAEALARNGVTVADLVEAAPAPPAGPARKGYLCGG